MHLDHPLELGYRPSMGGSHSVIAASAPVSLNEVFKETRDIEGSPLDAITCGDFGGVVLAQVTSFSDGLKHFQAIGQFTGSRSGEGRRVS